MLHLVIRKLNAHLPWTLIQRQRHHGSPGWYLRLLQFFSIKKNARHSLHVLQLFGRLKPVSWHKTGYEDFRTCTRVHKGDAMNGCAAITWLFQLCIQRQRCVLIPIQYRPEHRGRTAAAQAMSSADNVKWTISPMASSIEVIGVVMKRLLRFTRGINS